MIQRCQPAESRRRPAVGGRGVWAHRALNVGDDPFSFLAVYPADAGHGYATIDQSGFPRRVVRSGSGPVVTASGL